MRKVAAPRRAARARPALSMGDGRSVRELFEAVCDAPPETWRARLQALCDDEVRIGQVMALLEAQTDSMERVVAPLGRLIASMPVTELRVGDSLGVWKLVENLAVGGMGSVYVAERDDRLYRQRVAIKMLHGMPGSSDVERLVLERQILADLQHPNIVRLFDGGTTPAGNPYLVMEYVAGEPLDAWVRRTGIGLGERLQLFLRVCRAVQAAHQRLVVHCDLKPSNILVREDGEPVLLDFGIARLRSAGGTGAGYGTPGYASPEQLAGAPPGMASDVFSLGVVLTELCVGRRLGRTMDDRDTPPPLPSGLADDPACRRRLRGDIDAICARACALDPKRRYATASELIADIRRHLRTEPVRARGDDPVYLGTRFVIRNRWRFVGAALVVAALSVGLASALHGLAVAESQRRIAESRQHALENVVDFQQRMLGEIDPAAMGMQVLASGREHVRRRDGEAGARAFDRLMDGVDAPDIARQAVRDQILARAVALVREEFAHEPLVGADLGMSMADVYYELGLYREADALAGEVVQVRREGIGAASAQTLDAVELRARALERLGRFDEAAALVDRSLRDAPQAPDNQAARERLLAMQAWLHAMQGRLDEAIARQQALLRDMLGTRAPDDADLLSVHNQLGISLMRTGRPEDAREHLQRVVSGRVAALGPDHRATLGAQANLANLMDALGDLESALAMNREVLAMRRRVQGSDHPDTLGGLGNIVSNLLALGRNQEAYEHADEAWRLSRRVLGEDHGLTLRIRQNKALALRRLERRAEALPVQRAIVDARRRVLGEAHMDTLRSRFNLAELLSEMGLQAEARGHAQRMLETARSGTATPFGEVGMVLMLARIDERDGDTDAAVGRLRGQLDAFAGDRARLPDRIRLGLTLHGLYRDAGDADAALRLEDELLRPALQAHENAGGEEAELPAHRIDDIRQALGEAVPAGEGPGG